MPLKQTSASFKLHETKLASINLWVFDLQSGVCLACKYLTCRPNLAATSLSIALCRALVICVTSETRSSVNEHGNSLRNPFLFQTCKPFLATCSLRRIVCRAFAAGLLCTEEVPSPILRHRPFSVDVRP